MMSPEGPSPTPRISPEGPSPTLCIKRNSLLGRRRSYLEIYKSRTSFQLMEHRDSTLTYRDVMQIKGIDVKDVPWWTSYRMRYALLMFFGLYCLYGQRINLSLTIVSMVGHDYKNISVENSEDSCITSNTRVKGEFHWDKVTQGLILGASFAGLMTLQIPGGRFSEHFGAKKVIAYGMFFVAVTNMMTPIIARWNPIAFMVSRFFLGVAESVVQPSYQAFWAKWAPPLERSRLVGIAFAGEQLGNALIFPLAGNLSNTSPGWPLVFYVNGVCVFVGCIVWWCIVYDSPEKCPNITLLELRYIQLSIGKKISAGPKETPWSSFMKSKAVWAIIVVHVCSNYTACMLITSLPMYMLEVLNFNIVSNGYYLMITFLMFWLAIIAAALIADKIITKKVLSIANTRKLMTFIGNVGSGIFLVAGSFMTCHEPVKAVAMLSGAVGMCGFYYSGFYINHGDIAPAFAGTLFGITNTIATVSGVLAPVVTAIITTEKTHKQWQLVFVIAALVNVFGSVVYAVLGRGDVQEWAIYDGLLSETSMDGVNVLQGDSESDIDGESLIKIVIPS